MAPRLNRLEGLSEGILQLRLLEGERASVVLARDVSASAVLVIRC